jgi:hypothetical protein
VRQVGYLQILYSDLTTFFFNTNLKTRSKIHDAKWHGLAYCDEPTSFLILTKYSLYCGIDRIAVYDSFYVRAERDISDVTVNML